MLPTENLRRQHRGLLLMAGELLRLCGGDVAAEAAHARRVVAALAGALSAHLGAEDGGVYPRLFAHSDETVRSAARALFDEMGGLRRAFDAWVHKWKTAEIIAADAAGFAEETRALLDVVARRIDREDHELFPLVDKHGA